MAQKKKKEQRVHERNIKKSIPSSLRRVLFFNIYSIYSIYHMLKIAVEKFSNIKILMLENKIECEKS